MKTFHYYYRFLNPLKPITDCPEVPSNTSKPDTSSCWVVLHLLVLPLLLGAVQALLSSPAAHSIIAATPKLSRNSSQATLHTSPQAADAPALEHRAHTTPRESLQSLSLPAVWGVDLYNLIKPFRLPVNPMRLPRCTKGFPGWQPPPLPSVPGGATDSAQPIMILWHLIPFKHEVKISINLRAGF